jgi:hypothetical protein
MKNHQYISLAVVVFFSLCIKPSVHAQGSLTPPGAPAPTMKTADQIYAKLEARIAVNAVNTPGDSANLFIISNSGSYYLATNLVGVSGKSGIAINANNVTLDLNGFSLLGSTGSANGIAVPFNNSTGVTFTNVTVRNGTLNGWGQNGLYDEFIQQASLADYNSTSANWQNHIFENLNCTANGYSGIQVARGVIRNCQSIGNGGYGVWVVSTTVTGCLVQRNAISGIEASGYGCKIIGNTCIGNNTSADSYHAGINLESAAKNCRVEDNQVIGNSVAGIRLSGNDVTNNIVIKNSASGNGGVNYFVPSKNVFGPIANDSNGVITNSSPWGNFSF